MKTRFEIDNEVFNINDTLENMYKYYENLYKNHGFILDKENQTVYKDYDKEIQLNVGDRVDLIGFRIVIWKCIDLENNLILYSLEEE